MSTDIEAAFVKLEQGRYFVYTGHAGQTPEEEAISAEQAKHQGAQGWAVQWEPLLADVRALALAAHDDACRKCQWVAGKWATCELRARIAALGNGGEGA